MTQNELLESKDNWQPYENPNAFGYTAELLRLAAAEIRRLQTSVSTVQWDGKCVNAAIGTAEAGL